MTQIIAAINASTPMPPKANAQSQRRAAQAQMRPVHSEVTA
ncbi:MAG: hypothetical protein ACKVUS_11595 [Saprospiraceae bacterium]